MDPKIPALTKFPQYMPSFHSVHELILAVEESIICGGNDEESYIDVCEELSRETRGLVPQLPTLITPT